MYQFLKNCSLVKGVIFDQFLSHKKKGNQQKIAKTSAKPSDKISCYTLDSPLLIYRSKYPSFFQ